MKTLNKTLSHSQAFCLFLLKLELSPTPFARQSQITFGPPVFYNTFEHSLMNIDLSLKRFAHN